MNEQRIREIANQASDHAENTVEYFPDTEDGLDYPAKMMKVRDLKFAQLIVQECMRMCDCADSSYLEHGCDLEASGAAGAKETIKEWFGVEE
jgi:hypothetical protein